MPDIVGTAGAELITTVVAVDAAEVQPAREAVTVYAPASVAATPVLLITPSVAVAVEGTGFVQLYVTPGVVLDAVNERFSPTHSVAVPVIVGTAGAELITTVVAVEAAEVQPAREAVTVYAPASVVATPVLLITPKVAVAVELPGLVHV